MIIEVHNLNVGQGYATFIYTKSNNKEELYLIDAGKEPLVIHDYWHNNFNGIKITKLFISRWDCEHYNGLNGCDICFSENCEIYSPCADSNTHNLPVTQYVCEKSASEALFCTIYKEEDIKIICYNKNHIHTSAPTIRSATDQHPAVTDRYIWIFEFFGYSYYYAGDANEELIKELLDHSIEQSNIKRICHYNTGKGITLYAGYSGKANKPYKHIRCHTGTNIIHRYTKSEYNLTLTPIASDYITFIAPHIPGNNEGTSHDTWHTHTCTYIEETVKPEKNHIYNGNPVFDNIAKYFPDAQIHIDQANKTATIDECALHRLLNEKLENVQITLLPEKEEYKITSVWNDITLAGNIDSYSFELHNIGRQKLSIATIIKVFINLSEKNILSKLPSWLFPHINLSDINICRTLNNETDTATIGLKAAIQHNMPLGKITLNEIKATGATIINRINAEQYSRTTYFGLEFLIAFNKQTYKIHLSFSPNKTIDLQIDTQDIALKQITLLAEEFEVQNLSNWYDAFGFDTTTLRTAAAGLLIDKKRIRIQNISIGIDIKILSKFKFITTCTYYTSEKRSIIYGTNEKPIKSEELLHSFGVKKEHCSFLPSITLNKCELSANSSEKSFALHAITDITNIPEINIGNIKIKLTQFQVDIEHRDTRNKITLGLTGKNNSRNIELKAEYSGESGFTFEGHIDNIKISDAVEGVLSDIGLINKFNLPMKECLVRHNRHETTFRAALSDTELGECIKFTNNNISIGIYDKQCLFHIETLLVINIAEQDFAVESGLDITPKSIYLFAQSAKSYYNVLGIKGLDIGKMTICISEKLTPPGMSIGLLGELSYKDFRGDIALYLSPQTPARQLIAINFNNISLLDIVTIFVQCPNGGVSDTLSRISMQSILINDDITPGEDYGCDDAISKIDAYEREIGSYEIQTNEKYNWLSPTTKVIKNKTNFKTYELSYNNNRYELRKYVGMYACVNSGNEGIVINGTTFKPGFAFDAKLEFLGMSAVIDFTAEPKRGIRLYAEMERAINLGNFIEISHATDRSRGPILELSTYPEKRYFYLSAHCRILNLFEVETEIAFGNNRFTLNIYEQILGFKAYIVAKGSLNDWNSGDWGILLRYELSGFTQITENISNYLHKVADEIEKATKSATEKLECARRTVKEHERDVQDIQRKIDQLKSDLDRLTHTRYPWYQAYKYIALGAQIAAIGVSIGALATSKLVVLDILKTAQGILYMAEKAMEAAGSLSAQAMEMLGDVTAIVGKSIDWLIKIERIEATLSRENSNLEFNFQIDYQLCGKKFEGTFSMNNEEKLDERLENYITSSKKQIYKLTSGSANLEDIYGEMNEEEIEYLNNIDWERTRESLQIAAQQGDFYNQMMKNITADISKIEKQTNDQRECIIDSDNAQIISNILISNQIVQEKTAQLKKIIREEDFITLHNAEEVFRRESGLNITNSHPQAYNDFLKHDSNTKATAELRDYLHKTKSNITENEDIPKECIPLLIEKMEQQTNELSNVTNAQIFACIAEGYHEINNDKKALEYADKAIEASIKTYGNEANETYAIRERVSFS